MTIFKRAETYLAAYMVVGIATFGHAWNSTAAVDVALAPLVSVVSGMFWPLYLSVQLWK